MPSTEYAEEVMWHHQENASWVTLSTIHVASIFPHYISPFLMDGGALHLARCVRVELTALQHKPSCALFKVKHQDSSTPDCHPTQLHDWTQMLVVLSTVYTFM